MTKIEPYIISLLFMSVLLFTALIEALIKLWETIFFNNYFKLKVKINVDSELLINMATFFIKLFTTSKAFLVKVKTMFLIIIKA